MIVNIAVGAAVQVADWTAISAVATAAAALVALVVGLYPAFQSRADKRRIAKSVIQVVCAEAADCSFNVGVCRQVLEDGGRSLAAVDGGTYFLSELNVAFLREAVPYLDMLPPEVSEALTACVVDVQRLHRFMLQHRIHSPALRVSDVEHLLPMLRALEKSLEVLRRQSHAKLGMKFVDVDTDVTEAALVVKAKALRTQIEAEFPLEQPSPPRRRI